MDLEIKNFLQDFIKEINAIGIDVSGLQIDHIAYSTANSSEYDNLVTLFKKRGALMGEPIIGGRRVGVFKFNEPLSWEGHAINSMELIEPKTGEETISGWEHAEFLVDDYDEVLGLYPKLNWN